MTKIFNIFLTSFAIIIMASCSFESEKAPEYISVEINYGDNTAIKESKVVWKNGITALEALQQAAVVETHPVSNFVFVTSIDSIIGKRGVTAWYYKVNGKSPKKLAINNLLNPGDKISWIYKEDVCSKTVDKCKESSLAKNL